MDVRAIRERLNITQAELAFKTGIPRDRIAKWEQGKGVPKAEDQKVLEKVFGKNVPQNATRATETPQNGHQNSPGETPTLIGDLLNEIQYKVKPKPSIEDIATHIGVVRTYLNDLKNGAKPHSERIYNKLKEGYKDILNDMTTSTKLPAFEMKPSSTPTVQDVTIKNLSDVTKSQQDLLAEMSGKLISLVSKVIEKL